MSKLKIRSWNPRKVADPNRSPRAEQKSVVRMEDNLSKFIRTYNLLADPFAGTFYTVKACMVLPRHFRFVGSEIDDKYCKQSYYLVQTFWKQILKEDSDISGSKGIIGGEIVSKREDV